MLAAGSDTPRRTGSIKDADIAPIAWRAYGGEVESLVELTTAANAPGGDGARRALYALARVESEDTSYPRATFNRRFFTALRATRGTSWKFDGETVTRKGRPRLVFDSDGSVRERGKNWIRTPFLDADEGEDGAELMAAHEAAQTVELRLEAAREAESEVAPPKPRLAPMNAELRALRALIEEQLVRGHVVNWRSCALQILNQRGAWGFGCCDDDPEGELDEPTPRLSYDLRRFLARVERQMSRPAPKKAGVAKAWAKHANPANVARVDAAKALTTRLFGLLGVACQKGSSAEQRRYARSAEAREFAKVVAEAFDAAEAGDNTAAVELWAARQRTLGGEPYTPADTTRQRLL